MLLISVNLCQAFLTEDSILSDEEHFSKQGNPWLGWNNNLHLFLLPSHILEVR